MKNLIIKIQNFFSASKLNEQGNVILVSKEILITKINKNKYHVQNGSEFTTVKTQTAVLALIESLVPSEKPAKKVKKIVTAHDIEVAMEVKELAKENVGKSVKFEAFKTEEKLTGIIKGVSVDKRFPAVMYRILCDGKTYHKMIHNVKIPNVKKK